MPKERKVSVQHSTPMTKRQRARWEQEQAQQRRVMIGVSAIIALVVLMIVAGLVWDKVFVPSRTVATVGSIEISNGEYQVYRQIAQSQRSLNTANMISQYAEYQLGDTQSLQEELINDFATISSNNEPINYEWLNAIIDQKILISNAEAEGIVVTDEDVYQRIAGLIAASDPPPSPTATVSATTGISGTAPITPSTPVTPTATATLTPDETHDRVDQALQASYDRLGKFFAQPTVGAAVVAVPELPFSYDDFRTYSFNQEREQIIRERLGEKLVPEADAATEVVADADQIFIQVTTLPTDTAAVSETAWNTGLERANNILDRIEQGASFDDLIQSDSDYGKVYGNAQADAGLQPLSYWDNFQITEPISTQVEGEIGQPYRSPAGWHIVRVNERTTRPNQTELDTKRGEAIVNWIKAKREALGVKLFPEPTATPAPPTIDPALLPPTEDPALVQPTVDPAITPEAVTTPADGATPPAAATPTP